MDFEFKENYNIEDLLNIMQMLRSPSGCMWDREQDHKTIRNNFIEETYEVIEAIDNGDLSLLREELGDVLLQIVFHSQIEKENSSFTFEDVCSDISKKLILRHPHVFGSTKVQSSDDILENWDKIKKIEKKQSSYTDTLKSVPASLPALMRSEKVQKRAAKSGFDYENINQALNDLESEISELREAIEKDDLLNIKEEIGDLIFSAVNVSRFLKVSAEESLYNSCNKFISRFEKVEDQANKDGIDLFDANIDLLNRLWQEAKK